MENLFSLNTGIILRKEKFGGLAVKSSTIDVYILNNIGYEILQLCKEQAQNIRTIINSLVQKYNVSLETVTLDVREFIDHAFQNNLLKESGGKQ